MTLDEARAACDAAYSAKGLAARDLKLARLAAPELLKAARRAFNAAHHELAKAEHRLVALEREELAQVV